jgi:short-subunit dehydrogenase
MVKYITQLQRENWILVTGASTGIGRAITEYLAQKKFKVYAGVRKQKDFDELSKLTNVFPLILDVTSKENIESALDIIKNKKTGLHGLVNNAGIAVAGPLMDISIEDFKKQFEVNVFGIHQVTKAFFPLLLESHGRIVMMSSDSGFFATPFFGPYCSSKFAIEGYSDSLRRELLLYDVDVIILQPGRITTPIWDKGKELMEKFKDSIFAKEAQKIGEYAIRKGKTAGLNPIKVAELVDEVLTTPNPKTRYLIAPSVFKYKMIKILSDKKIDKTIKKELAELS